MLSAEDYIAMRGNAHRAKWLTYAVFLTVCWVVLCALFYQSILEDDGIIFLNGEVVMLVMFGGGAIGAFGKAFRKERFDLGEGSGSLTPMGGIGDD